MSQHVTTAIRSARVQWIEAPWFVMHIVAIAAVIGLIIAGNPELAVDAIEVVEPARAVGSP